MKIFFLIFISFFLIGCSGDKIQELVFRKTLERNLIELCGDEDKECIAAVESQIENCLEKSDWKKFVDNQDDQNENNRFSKELYSCIVDSEGNPYFETSQ